MKTNGLVGSSGFVIGLVDGLVRISGLVGFCCRICFRAHLDYAAMTPNTRVALAETPSDIAGGVRGEDPDRPAQVAG